MAFNTSSSAEKRAVMNPKDLRFTQTTIGLYFNDPNHPSLEESVSLIQRRKLDPAVYGELSVHREKLDANVVWCEDNRRLYVLRKAGVSSVSVKFVNRSRPSTEADKNKLKDPAFIPKIRGEASGDQIPLPSSSGPSVYQEQKETSLLGVVGSVSAALVAGYWGWKLYKSQQDNDGDENEN